MRLTVETGPLSGTVIHLERDVPTLIGSSPASALRIQEAGVIEEHAVVKALKGSGFGIKAHGAVRVNGSEVQASPLSDGDVIEIGTTRIAFGQTQERGLPNISGYRIIDVLGRGGMGTVYRAEQVSLHRQVALKVLKQEQTSDPSFIAQFVAEARAAAKLQHPNVVSVFDVEHDGDTYYYAMELMHEGSCEDWLKQNGVMPVDRALQVIADAAAGLAYAESLGIVHRDIKPDNLMLDQHGAIKIADLGLASNATDATEERAIGTPHFMAPEQVLSKDLDHRTDLYALGCTFYRLVTGKTPFRGQTVKDILRAQVKDQPEPASRVNPEVPAEVAAIIQRLMAKEPNDRYQTANDLIEELEALLQPQQKRSMWIALAATAVLVAGGAIAWALTRPDKTKIVEVEKRYDDPEKQQFADRIKVLEAEAIQLKAQNSFLTARSSGLIDQELAKALDQVAITHKGTTAADEATELASAIRAKVAARAEQAAERRARIAAHLTAVRQATTKPLDAYDYELAMRALDVKPPQDVTNDQELTDGISKLRGEITEQARARLETLRTNVREAGNGGDVAKLTAAIEALELGLQPETRWPKVVQEEVSAAKADISNARTTLATLQKLRRAGVWQTYHALLLDPQGFRSHLDRCDFAAAAQILAAFASDGATTEAATRAKALEQVMQLAATFATALEQACASGSLQVAIGEDGLEVVRWDRQKNEFTFKNGARGRKEETVSGNNVTIEQWLELANQVTGTANGARQCFVGLLAINQHCHAATTYLSQLSKSSDDSGVGAQAYPFSADVLEHLLSKLPNGSETWSQFLGDELQAGKRLAAGLRALSEKRNTAAAGHIEKLFTEHPHSVVVAVLP